MFSSILLAIVGFIGALAVKQLMNIAKSVNEIKVEIGMIVTKQAQLDKENDEIKERVTRLEMR